MAHADDSAQRQFPISARRKVFSALCVAWMVVFAVVHVAWALGSGFGLPAGFEVPGHTALFIIDIIAIPLCLIGAVLAIAQAHPRAERFVKVVIVLSWATALLGVVHSINNIIADIGMVFGLVAVPTSPYDRITDFLFEPWWLVGGILFGLAAWALQVDSHTVWRANRVKAGVTK
jgi:hypothetical protein